MKLEAGFATNMTRFGMFANFDSGTPASMIRVGKLSENDRTATIFAMGAKQAHSTAMVTSLSGAGKVNLSVGLPSNVTPVTVFHDEDRMKSASGAMGLRQCHGFASCPSHLFDVPHGLPACLACVSGITRQILFRLNCPTLIFLRLSLVPFGRKDVVRLFHGVIVSRLELQENPNIDSFWFSARLAVLRPTRWRHPCPFPKIWT